MRSRPLGALFAVAFAALFLSGCPARLPGPSDCERMALSLARRGEPPDGGGRTNRRFVQELVRACLTTPFDHETVDCIGETGDLVGCAATLARRFPERKPALKRALKRVQRHR